MSCHCNQGPCADQPTPTDCEPLPSALDNFIREFFGVLTKTVDGEGNVSWVLPCDLATGIVANPRLENEGLACYFKRLLTAGVDGNEGPQGIQGIQGVQGEAGGNSYALTADDFTQPVLGGTVSILLADAAWVAVGMVVYVATAGYFTVTGKTGSTINAQLIDTTGFTGTVTAGKLTTAGGKKGAAGTNGTNGTNGAAGDPGAAGASGGEFFVGAGVPDNGTGADSDMYFRSNGEIYFKAAGSWVFFANIKVSTVNAQTGTSYTLAATDANNIVTLDNAAAITLTVPANIDVPMLVGTKIWITVKGAGQVTVVGDGAAVVNGLASADKSAGQYAKMLLIQEEIDVWNLSGDTVP